MNGQDLTIQKLDIGFIEEIVLLERASFPVPWSYEAYEHELKENTLSHYYGVFEGSRMIAFMGFWLIGEEGHIANVAVDPTYRKQGVGEYLMRQVMLNCYAMGGKRMTLEVRQSNTAALALYQKLGFVIAGRRKAYYSDTKEDALIMWGAVPAPF